MFGLYLLLERFSVVVIIHLQDRFSKIWRNNPISRGQIRSVIYGHHEVLKGAPLWNVLPLHISLIFCLCVPFAFSYYFTTLYENMPFKLQFAHEPWKLWPFLMHILWYQHPHRWLKREFDWMVKLKRLFSWIIRVIDSATLSGNGYDQQHFNCIIYYKKTVFFKWIENKYILWRIY